MGYWYSPLVFYGRADEIPEDLQNLREVNRRIEAGSCVLFLGAGASRPAGGPSAQGLANELRERFAPDLPASLGLRRLANFLSTRRRIDCLRCGQLHCGKAGQTDSS